jgi:hypothetical protein
MSRILPHEVDRKASWDQLALMLPHLGAPGSWPLARFVRLTAGGGLRRRLSRARPEREGQAYGRPCIVVIDPPANRGRRLYL